MKRSAVARAAVPQIAAPTDDVEPARSMSGMSGGTTGWTRTLRHRVSRLDGSKQPYVFLGGPSARVGAPLLIVLHPMLADVSAESFIQLALPLAGELLSHVSHRDLAGVLVPFARGNGGWLGATAVELFDLLTERPRGLESYGDLMLLGLGSGATGALQLAAWHPGRFAAVAAIGPAGAIDEPPTTIRSTSSMTAVAAGSTRRGKRRAIDNHANESTTNAMGGSPYALRHAVGNLAGCRLLLDRPWWSLGQNGTAGRTSFERLLDLLRAADIAFDLLPEKDELVRASGDWLTRADDILNWFDDRPPMVEPTERRLSAANLRGGQAEWAGFLWQVEPERPCELSWRRKPDGSVAIGTVNLAAFWLSVDALPAAGKSLSIDSMKVAGLTNAAAIVRCLIERRGKAWVLQGEYDPVTTEPPSVICKSPVRPGGFPDLLFGAITIVYGTLADETGNLAMETFAEMLRQHLVERCSTSDHPGCLRTLLPLAVVADVDALDATAREGSVIFIGSPRENAALSAVHHEQRAGWPEGSGGFEVADATYDRAGQGLWCLGPRPDRQTGYWVVVACNDVDRLFDALCVPLASIGDYLVFEDARPVAGGFFGMDWR